MSLLDPIVPYLGPLGPALAVSGTLVVILGLIGIVSFMLYKVKRDIFETSVGWVGATVVLSLITILFRGMTYLCGCAWYYDTGGNPTALVPLTYMLITGSFFAIIYNFNIPPLKKHKWLISIPLSVPIAIVSNLFFPLVEKGKKAGPGSTELPPEKQGFSYFTYGLLGRRISKILPLFSGLKQVLSLAGMKIGYKAYVSSMIFSALLGGGLSFFVWFFLFTFGLGSALGLGGFSIFSILGTLLLSIAFAFITGAAILGFFYILPSMKVGSRRQRLDTYLPFTSSYMTVLASAGVTPERMLRSTAEKDPKFMLSDEIANVVGRIDLLGYDVLNAINAEVDRSPSTNYQDLLRGFGGVIRTGGDMKKFFQGITDHLFQKRSLQVQAFLDSLGIIAETYVLMLIAFPLMLVVMLSIMASIGGSLGGIDVFSFMYLMAFILIPICGVMFLFILDTMQPKG